MERSEFRKLVELHQQRTYWAAYRILGHHDDTLDVLQETFLRFHERHRTVPRERVGAWLSRVAANRAIDVVRKRGTRREVSVKGPIRIEEREETISTEEREATMAALGKLSQRQREVITLRIWEGVSFADIARQLGITEGATKTHFKRGIQALREGFAGRWHETNLRPPSTGQKGERQ